MIYGRKSIIHGITFCFSIVLILFLTSCEKGLSIKEAVEEFSLEDAKVFHLEHAADLRLPNGGNNVKSTIDYEEILVPQWDNATYHEVQFPSKLAKTYEIPLNTGTIVGGVLLKEKGDSYERATMKSSLVIQEFSQREKKTLRQMVVTVIGNDSNGNVNSEAFTYMGSHNTLTGFMVVSTLEGKIVNIFQYINGIRSRVYVKHSEDTADNAPLYGFSFLKAHGTKSSYGNSEPGICYMCGKEGMVYIQYGNICESCLEGSELLDGIIVTPNQGYCEKCGRLQDECVCNPFACNVCGQEPCICDGPGSACEYCGYLGCNGECRGDGDGGGSSGTTPGAGEWWEGGHRYITESALSGVLTTSQINAIVRGSTSVDNYQSPESSHMHAMLEPGVTQTEGISRMREFFRSNMLLFVYTGNYEYFGKGIHCIQDAYSPAHNFQNWGGFSDIIPHLFESVHIYPMDAKNAIDATESIYNDIITSDGSGDEIDEIFNNWLEDFYDE